jgi:hemerythrin-like domain-containing protein
MDIVDALRDDHEAALATAREMSETDDPARARKLFRSLKKALGAHSRAEEAVVYGALKRLGEDGPVALAHESEVEHALLDSLLAEMEASRASSAAWQARAKVAFELLAHHIEQEHDQMFALLRRHFDTKARELMAARFARRRQEISAARV